MKILDVIQEVLDPCCYIEPSTEIEQLEDEEEIIKKTIKNKSWNEISI